MRKQNLNIFENPGRKERDDSWKIIRQTHMGSYSLTNIFRLLWINKFKISFRYIPRFLWVLWMSCITLPLRVIEKIRFQKKIRNTKLAKDPIFIIGFYRTATTLLHTLFSKDKQFGYMSNLDGFTSQFNLSFSDFARNILERRMPKTRPMDNIDMKIDDPQEESYAIGALSKYGITNSLIFPQNYEYFTKFLTFEECSPKDLEKWKKVYLYFVQKTTLKNNGKQIVLKNPANGSRITHLLEMYPNAKFIYSYRNPYTLFCSMKILLQKLMEISALQTWDEFDIENQFVKLLGKIHSTYDQTKSLIPPENFYTLKYEDFIKNPLPFLHEIYEEFDLKEFEEAKPVFQEYLDAKKDYIANKHEITPRIVEIINTHWEKYRISHGYDRLNPTNIE